MRIVFLFCFIFHGCTSNNPKPDIIKPSKPSKGFICNYKEQQENCRAILKSHHQSKEKIITSIICDSLIPCWYGTPWNFYGTSEIPGKGNIACGYFVTTIIRDAGIPINRIKMAQCASEEMIKSVCQPASIKRFSNKSIGEFVTHIKNSGLGLYLTGLDSHTGFVYNDGREVYFIHSSYVSPKCVVKETALRSSILYYSKYRVVGKLKI